MAIAPIRLVPYPIAGLSTVPIARLSTVAIAGPRAHPERVPSRVPEHVPDRVPDRVPDGVVGRRTGPTPALPGFAGTVCGIAATTRAVARRRTTVVTSILSTVAIALLLLVVTASPAAAHGGTQDEPPTNYRADITQFDPGVPGVALHIAEATSRLELVNRGPATVVVMGYEGDQYLRIGPDGVFENERSGSVYINANFSSTSSGSGSGGATGSAAVPPDVDAKAPPRWRQVSTEPVAVWHDHRTHWMAPTEAVVERDPGRSHVVNEKWVVPFVIDGRTVEATGTITWVPGPNVLVWLTAVVGVAALGIVASTTKWWRAVMVVSAVLLLVLCAIDAVSEWVLSPAPPGEKLASLVVPALAAAAVVAGLALLRRREQTAVLLLGAGGAALALLFGWASREYLTYSQVPAAFADLVARLTVAGALSFGAILVGAMLVQRRRELAFLIRPAPRPRAPRSSPPPASN